MIANPEDTQENCPAPLTRSELVRRIRKRPDDVLLLACLVDAYLEEGKYSKALKVSSKAHNLAPENPLVVWDHARALYVKEQFSEAMMLLREILKSKVRTIAAHMRWTNDKAKQFQNTSRFDLALCYIQLNKFGLAAKHLEGYLARCRGGSSYYSPDLARAKIRCIKKIKRQAARHSMRLWISFLEIRMSSTGRRVKYRKGFTNGLAMARTLRDAIEKLREGLDELGYELVAAEDTEEFDRRCLKTELPASTHSLAEAVRKDRSPRFMDFFMYPERKKKE